MTIRTNRAIGGIANSANNAGLGLGANRSPAFQTIHWYLDFNGLQSPPTELSYTNPPGGVASDATAGNFTSTDQYLIMSIPQYTAIQSIQAICETAIVLGAGARLDIGDKTANSATFYVNNATTLTAGTVLTQAQTGNPLYFYGAAADQLLLKVTSGSPLVATGVLHVIVNVCDMTDDKPTTINF
jgi:hypothetical protein